MDAEGLAELHQLLFFPRINENEGDAFFTGAGGASAAVGVVVDLLGKLMMNDEGQVFDIDSASGDVGGDQELGALFFEGAHDLITFELGEVALQDADRVAAVGEFFTKNVSSIAGAGKDEAAQRTLSVKEFIDEVGLVILDADGETMVDVAVDDVPGVNLDRFGIGRHAEFDEFIECPGEGGGEKPGGSAIHADFNRRADLVFETHGKHFVGFIKNEILDMIEGDRLAFEKVVKSSGGCHEDVGGALEAGDLNIDLIPAGCDFEEDPLVGILGEFEEGFMDLFGEFAGGSENEALNLLLPGIDLAEQGEAKSGGLPGAGLGLRHEVMPALEKVGD